MEALEVVQALRRDHVRLHQLVPSYRGRQGTPHERARVVVAAMNALAMGLIKTG